MTAAWETRTPSETGFTDKGLQAVLDLVGASNSQSFVLLRDGRVVAEQYWMGADETTTRDIASALVRATLPARAPKPAPISTAYS